MANHVNSILLKISAKSKLYVAGIRCSKLTIEALEQSCEICSKLTINTPKQCHWHRFGVFVNFEHISHFCSSVSVVNFEHVNAGRDM